MTQKQYELVKKMQDTLVEYMDTLEDLNEKERLILNWFRFRDKSHLDDDKELRFCSSSSFLLHEIFVIGLLEGMEAQEKEELEQQKQEFKHRQELKKTQHWKRKRKGKS